MKLVLVTGAGASRNLARDDELMPLMTDWSARLCAALDQREAGLAAVCGLAPSAPGPQFEQALGLLLRWDQMRPLQERFLGLGGETVGQVNPALTDAHKRAQIRLDSMLDVVNTSLYQEFGQDRIDADGAEAAYGELLRRLGDPKVAVATTNYDRSVEEALMALGRTVNTGFPRRGQRTPRLSAAGLWDAAARPQWCFTSTGQSAGTRLTEWSRIITATNRLIPRFRTPVVLYPDPEKDPTAHELVSQIWTESCPSSRLGGPCARTRPLAA